MKTGILVTARLGSTRLQRKHLLEVGGRPIISYLLERIATAFAGELASGDASLIIATSDEPENREFERFALNGVTVFYGAASNIPLRHLQAARVHGLDGIVAVDGDDVLCATEGMRRVFEALSGGSEYVRTSGLPFGINSFGYSTAFLAGSLAAHCDATLETGWGRIFDETRVADIPVLSSVTSDSLRFTLDYEADYRFFTAVIERLGERVCRASAEEIVAVVMADKLYTLNEAIMQEYWINFNRNKEKEAATCP